MPQPEKQLDVIKVTGLAANVERAKLGLLERVKELQAEQEDRVITFISFSVSVNNCLVEMRLGTGPRKQGFTNLPFDFRSD